MDVYIANLKTYNQCIAEIYKYIIACAKEIGEFGDKYITDWPELILKTIVTFPSIPEQVNFIELSHLLEKFDTITNDMELLIEKLLDMEMLKKIEYGSNRTFSENIKGIVAKINSLLVEYNQIRTILISTTASIGGTLATKDDTSDLFSTKNVQKTGFVIELYIGALSKFNDERTIEELKDFIFDKTITDVPKDLAPIQYMIYKPQILKKLASKPEDNVVNVSLNTRDSYHYSPEVLYTREEALKYGPISNFSSGIDNNIVERFKTIKKIPMSTKKPEFMSTTLPDNVAALNITYDNGASFYEISDSQKWNPQSSISKIYIKVC